MPFPFDSDELSRKVIMEVMAFIVNFEAYVNHETEQEESLSADRAVALKFVPGGVSPLIDHFAYSSADEFIANHDLEDYSNPSSSDPSDLRKTLAYILMSVGRRGYLYYKFRQFDYLPLSNKKVDVGRIADKMASWGSTDYPSLATNIEVFLQRVISVSTEPRLIVQLFQNSPYLIREIMEPFLEDWAGAVRTAQAFGILIAKAEYSLDEERLSRIEVSVRDHSRIGNVFINSEVQGDFITAHNYLAAVGSLGVGAALRNVINEVAVSGELAEETRAELLQQLGELSRQAALAPEERAERGVIKAILNATAGILGAGGALATVWATWGNTISKFFGF